ncbi:AAA family ATPase [Aliarcobacter cryaerophilus]|jgi:wobble nucleotide-excising tRNase|uniref:AAA family ATPase n=1 Tax=Aliarcobacter cryaerophilus TaxID=28198 RepID=UPI001653EECA|nr:AAA family ATPase [Aliarcobacter cryaerophilus]QNM88211.1 AAA family ATPase [Aliarcobacter cryaerophilus]
MGSTLTQIAGQLQSSQKKVQLIYAFNGTGKTRLSKEFKQLISPKNDDEESEETRAKILYYNAFTEDLFSWDNDLENDSELKLKIQPNSFTQWILQEQGQDQNIVTSFQRFSGNKLTPTFSPDFSEVTFSFESGNDENLTNVKISKGEESNFIWSIFYTLIKQVINVLNVQEITDRETDQFNNLEYVFIDDPVSSLDENHLIELAVNLSQLIKSSNSDIKFILSTHNPLFYNVLYNELGLKSKKGSFMLIKNDDGTFDLEVKDGDSNKSFSYHLYLRDTIKHAIEHNEIAKYHFVLLRNLYEKTANFLGYEKWSDLLPDEDREAYISRVMNFYSHSSLSSEQIAEPTDPEKQMVKFLFNYLIDNSKFWKQVENNES